MGNIQSTSCSNWRVSQTSPDPTTIRVSELLVTCSQLFSDRHFRNKSVYRQRTDRMSSSRCRLIIAKSALSELSDVRQRKSIESREHWRTASWGKKKKKKGERDFSSPTSNKNTTCTSSTSTSREHHLAAVEYRISRNPIQSALKMLRPWKKKSTGMSSIYNTGWIRVKAAPVHTAPITITYGRTKHRTLTECASILTAIKGIRHLAETPLSPPLRP